MSEEEKISIERIEAVRVLGLVTKYLVYLLCAYIINAKQCFSTFLLFTRQVDF